MEREFLEMMPHTITVAALTGRDSYTKPTHSTATTSYRARVVGKQSLVRATDGLEKLARTVIYVNSTAAIDSESLLTLPDGTTPPILAVHTVPDEKGTHHVVIYCGD